MRKQLTCAIAASICMCTLLQTAPLTSYANNPICSTAFAPDPAPVVFGDELWVFTGCDRDGNNDNYYMVGWQAFSTTDMQNWTNHGMILKDNEFSWCTENNAWASQCIERNGKYYFYFTTTDPQRGREIGVGVADKPEGPYKDVLGKPLVGPDWAYIDPTVMIDDDGQAWLMFGNPDCYYVKLKEDMVTLDGQIQKFNLPLPGGTKYGEGPWICKHGNLYYFVFASFVLRYFVSKVLNKLNYDVRLKLNPLMRKRNYVSRVFYLNDFAKELRLHPRVGDALEKEFQETNDEIVEEQRKVGFKRTILNFTRDYVVGDFIMDGLYITYLVFQAAVLHTIDYSNAVVLFNRTGSLRRGMANMADIFPKAQENSLYVDKIRAFLDYEPKMKAMEGEAVPAGNAELSLEHVSFRYQEEMEDTLKDVTMKVKPGEKVAIVGYNGAGKTTLIKLLMRLYDPTGGEIFYHGQNIKSYKPYDYRHRIGVVFQDYQMYGASLRENVVMRSLEDAEDETKVISALERAGFGERLKTLPKGLETQVTAEFDKEGVNFSGGESQKIAISIIKN